MIDCLISGLRHRNVHLTVRFASLFVVSSIVLLVTACSNDPTSAPEATAEGATPGPVVTQEKRQVVSQAPSPAPGASAGAIVSPQFVRSNIGGIAIEALIYDSRSHEAVVLDQKGGPGSEWPTARAAGQAAGGIGAINAGFFTPEGTPLGLVITDGQRRGDINRASSLGSGFYTVSSSGNPALIRRDRFQGARESIQAGPFLIEGGSPVGGLSDKSSSARTFIATDGGSGWILARTGPCSLRQLASALAGASIGPTRVRSALNLDGGRSSEIWASKSIPGGASHTRPIWNKEVRNFLVVREK